MTLAVGTELGVGALPDDVWSDLRRILRGDTVSSGTVAATFTLVRYSRTVDSGPAHRIDDLANVYSDQATIHGVGSSFLLPGGEPITNYAGITLQFSDGSVATIYDVEECNGDGYCVRDSNGDWIKAPTFVNLFHELAHAYHFVSGTMPASAPDQEFQAETEENWVRGAEDLPLRDPTNHALDCGVCSGDCFIASAASAHFSGQDFWRLKWLRDHVFRAGPIGRKSFDAMFGEYDQYSAIVAADMIRDEGLRRAVFWLAVRPLLTYYWFLIAYLRGEMTTDAITEMLGRLAAECRAVGTEARVQWSRTLSPAGVARDIGKVLLERGAASRTAVSCAEVWDASNAISYLAGAFDGVPGSLVLSRWALIRPLIWFWETVELCEVSGAIPLRRWCDWFDSWSETVPFDEAVDRAAVIQELQSAIASLPATAVRSG